MWVLLADAKSSIAVLLYVIFIKEPELRLSLVLCEQIPGGSATCSCLANRESGTTPVTSSSDVSNWRREVCPRCRCCEWLAGSEKRLQGTECYEGPAAWTEGS